MTDIITDRLKMHCCLESQESLFLIIANTVKGKGVSFMENVPIWHYRMPNEEELMVLMKELNLTKEDLEK